MQFNAQDAARMKTKKRILEKMLLKLGQSQTDGREFFKGIHSWRLPTRKQRQRT
jgi:hypothetical protein